MNRESFIQQINQCIYNATGRYYSGVDLTRMTDQGLIQFAEMVRDLLTVRGEVRANEIVPRTNLPPSPTH